MIRWWPHQLDMVKELPQESQGNFYIINVGR
jgi:hypothetical protein